MGAEYKTREEKDRLLLELSRSGRPISNIVESRKGNHAVDYDGDALLARSRNSAPARAERYSKVLSRLAKDKS
jgi:hypothetical protein